MTGPTRAGRATLALVLSLVAFRFEGLLIFLAPGLLATSLEGLSGKRAVLFSLLWGMLFSALFHLWAFNYHYGPALWLLLVLLRGLPWLLFPLPSVMLERLSNPGLWSGTLATGLGSALVSWALLLGPSGMDWEIPFTCLAYRPWCLSLLPWTGLVGGSFLIGFISYPLLSGKPRGPIVGIGLLGCWLAVHAVTWTNRSPEPLPRGVALIQTGWQGNEKWARENARPAADRLFGMTRQAAVEGADLVIWPETAWPARGLLKSLHDRLAVSDLATELQIDILVSSIEEEGDDWYSSAALVSPEGEFGPVYRKRRLLPLAEYLPLPDSWDQFFRERDMVLSTCRYRSGTEPTLFRSGQRAFSVLICYESLVPWPARSYDQAELLVVVTNDSHTRSEFAKEAHFRSSVLRAAQERKTLFQCANNGVSGIVNSLGVVVERTKPGFVQPKIIRWDEDRTRAGR